MAMLEPSAGQEGKEINVNDIIEVDVEGVKYKVSLKRGSRIPNDTSTWRRVECWIADASVDARLAAISSTHTFCRESTREAAINEIINRIKYINENIKIELICVEVDGTRYQVQLTMESEEEVNCPRDPDWRNRPILYWPGECWTANASGRDHCLPHAFYSSTTREGAIANIIATIRDVKLEIEIIEVDVDGVKHQVSVLSEGEEGGVIDDEPSGGNKWLGVRWIADAQYGPNGVPGALSNGITREHALEEIIRAIRDMKATIATMSMENRGYMGN